MSLTLEEKAKIVDKLNQLDAVNAPCPQCRNPDWALMDGLMMIPVRTVPQLGQIAPFAGAVCPRCGLTRFFNLLILGFDDIVRRFQSG
jgi:hypothetical protein